MLGRVLEPGEVATPGGSPVAVVSHRFWQSRLAADPSAVGRTVRVNGVELSVVGVLPDGFQGTVLGLQFDLWVPATMAPVILGGSRELDDRRSRGYSVMARLPRAAQVAAVAAAAAAAMRDLAERYPESNRGVGVEVLPYWRAPRGPQRMFLQALGVLQGLMLVLLLAVCGNTATLLLARSASRQRELAVRLAMGASPWRVARLLLAESLVVGVLGAALGAVLAAWGVQALRAVPADDRAADPLPDVGRRLGLAVALGLGVACAAAGRACCRRAGASASTSRPASPPAHEIAGAGLVALGGDGGGGGPGDGRAGRRRVVPGHLRRHPRHRPGLRAPGRAAGRLRPLRARRRRRRRGRLFVERALDGAGGAARRARRPRSPPRCRSTSTACPSAHSCSRAGRGPTA